METYKGWLITKHQGKTYLASNRNFLWTSFDMTAECQHGCEVGNCLAFHKCSCGFYSLYSPGELIRTQSHYEIFGVVYNYGIINQGFSGVRSESIQIRALYTADIDLANRLKETYPEVSIEMPTPELLELQERLRNSQNIAYKPRNYDYQAAQKRREQRIKEQQAAIKLGQEKFPGGLPAEQTRLLDLLQGANRQQIIEFAKQYASTPEWLQRLWLWKAENSKKAKPGDIVFEADDVNEPYVFIGSVRRNGYQSIRWLLNKEGVLVRRYNIRKWDEIPSALEARKKAIEEWL